MGDGLGRSPTRKQHRLAVRWRKVNGRVDTIGEVAPRLMNADLRFIFDVLNDDVRRELERRGYDPLSMRFQIDRSAEAVAAWPNLPPTKETKHEARQL